MIDQLMGLLMLGLGMKTPVLSLEKVKAESTQVQVTQQSNNGTYDSTVIVNGEVKQNIHETNINSSDIHRSLRVQTINGETVIENSNSGEASSADGKLKEKKEQLLELYKKKHEEFKIKLSLLKDTRKKEIITKLDTKLQEVNTRRTQILIEQLKKLSAIIDKIAVKAADLKVAGRDTIALEAAIVKARFAIAKAQEALDAQAIKTYTFTITSDTLLKSNAVNMINSLEADFQNLHVLVKSAHKAVEEAVGALKMLIGEEYLPTKTTTPTGGAI